MTTSTTTAPDHVRQLFATLPQGHALHVLFEEHERILGYLTRLDALLEEFREDAGSLRSHNAALEVEQVAKNLICSEPHDAREEEVLFPALEVRCATLLPLAVRQENHELRMLKLSLAAAAFADHPDPQAIAKFGGTLSARMREHIANENEVIYPMALDLLRSPAIWKAMDPALQQIGPCEWSRDLFV